MKKIWFIVMVMLLVLVGWPSAVIADWTTDSTESNPICTAANDQYYPQIISDGSGGAIITWSDNRSGSHDIYAQRVSPGRCSGPTALTFATASATSTNGHVYLSWQTGVEVSAGDFVIQRSESRKEGFVTLVVTNSSVPTVE